MAKTVEVYRLEHIKCSRNRMPKGVHHGPLRGSQECRNVRPSFGYFGAEPSYITLETICGVTRRQIAHWWGFSTEYDKKIPLWYDAGWQFVLYKLPKTRVRWDNRQVVFNPNNSLNRQVLSWAEVPRFPPH